MLIRAVYRKYDGDNKELDFLVSKVKDISCGDLEIIMKEKALKF